MEHFEDLMAFVRDQAAAAGFDRSLVGKIALASEEAIVNVIHYAFPDGNGTMEIRAEQAPDGGLRLQIIDSGIAFDPLAKEMPDTHAPPQDRPIGGLGIFMIRQIMDDVSYERKDGRNVLTLYKSG